MFDLTMKHQEVWCLWWERIARNFEWCERTILDLKLQFVRALFEQMTASGFFSFSNLIDFIDHCTSSICPMYLVHSIIF